jgi:hypothetical protein
MGFSHFSFFIFKNMKVFKTSLFLSLLFILILLGAILAKAEMPDDHKLVPCIGCHKETLGADNGYGDEICDECHKYRTNSGTGGIDVPKMEAEHNPNICQACHIGNTEINGSERDIYHNAHNTIQCSVCHVDSSSSDNSDVRKIKEGTAFQCVSCHGSKIHSIHAGNLSKACPVCHGSWAAGKTTYNPESSSLQSAKAQKGAALEQFTVLDIIKNIFNIILKAF